MAVYSIKSAMENYNIKNNDMKKLGKTLLIKENFIGIITMYDFNYKEVESSYIYTDKKSFDIDKNKYLDIDYPFNSKVVQDNQADREMQREI